MKIKLAFIAIAVIAIASAFTSSSRLTYKYQYISTPDGTYFIVDQTDLTGNTSYRCNTPTTPICTKSTNTQVAQVLINGNLEWVIPQTGSTEVKGTFAP